MTMTRTRAALLLAGVFLLGVVCGGLAIGAFMRHAFHGKGPFAFGRPDRMQHFIVRKLTHRLDLDEAQQRALEAAVSRARADLDQIHDETLPRVEAIIERSFDEFAPVLRPDQLERFEEIRARTRERLRRHRGP